MPLDSNEVGKDLATAGASSSSGDQRTAPERRAAHVCESASPCAQRLVEAQVLRSPDAVAIVFKSQHVTYQQLNARANQLAHKLRRLGVGPDVPIGVCMHRSPEVAAAILGVLKVGGAYVPLDPAYPKER